MKRKLSVVLVMVVVLSLIIAAPAGAKKPQSALTGDMELYFNLGFGQATACPDIVWAGTVELNDVLYGMAFFPTGEKNVGKVHHFWEDWKIYDTPFDFTGGVLTECTPGAVVLAGNDSGVSSPNDTYRMNGVVDEAFDPFEEWDGRRVHMSGVITWQVLSTPDGDVVVPETGPGTFRLN